MRADVARKHVTIIGSGVSRGILLAALLVACTPSRSRATASGGGAGSGATETGVLIGPRSEFARGTCVAYAGETSHAGTTVFVDPGHGGIDTGAVSTLNGTTIEEKTLTLAVALDLAPLLESTGYRVVLSRTRDTTVARLRPGHVEGASYTALGARSESEARVDCANAAHAKLLLAIHFDAFYDPTVGGAETLYDAARPFGRKNRQFAALVQRALVEEFRAAGWSVPDRGIQTDSQAGTPALTQEGAVYGHLLELGPAVRHWFPRASGMPGVLVEPLFITDDAEATVATSRRGQSVMARALARAIGEYFTGRD